MLSSEMIYDFVKDAGTSLTEDVLQEYIIDSMVKESNSSNIEEDKKQINLIIDSVQSKSGSFSSFKEDINSAGEYIGLTFDEQSLIKYST